jgi:5-formyltetrahydrofolate cyclo-ligase
MIEKKQLRKAMQLRLRQLNAQTHQNWSNQIRKLLFQHPKWRNAKTVGVTISYGKEIDTRVIIEQAWAEGKRVVVPKCDHDSKQMTFYMILSYNQLEEGYKGILEPIEAVTTAVKAEKIDLLLVPGLVFDMNGYRIGYGGGFYDRYMEHYNGFSLSLAFTCQVLREIPIDTFDQPVQGIITNRGVIHIDGC